VEYERQDDRELSEYQVKQDECHAGGSKELGTAGGISRYQVACAPWHALRRCHRLGWHRL
jgi:hypothetical protein